MAGSVKNMAGSVKNVAGSVKNVGGSVKKKKIFPIEITTKIRFF